MPEEHSNSATPENHPPESQDNIGNPEIQKEISLEDFNPKGTLTLALLYILLVILLWFFMYFGEFANHGPSIMN